MTSDLTRGSLENANLVPFLRLVQPIPLVLDYHERGIFLTDCTANIQVEKI